uniref:Transposase n=1 Tax=Neogobius melanostomus TaxID=47308 RepID=A0A8C6U465_9GOBI
MQHLCMLRLRWLLRVRDLHPQRGSLQFASHAHLMSFWSQIEPATQDILHVTRAQTAGNVSTSLQPIDEFFLFLMYLSLGLVHKDLAHRFKVHQSTVRRVISTWADFLYTVLGAIGVWLDEETVKRNMPEVFSDYADTHIVLDCAELRCKTPDSGYNSLRTFKGLVGMAPHDPVTFVSPLYQGDSDRDILKQSGLVPLLKPSMAIMVHKGFHVQGLVPCSVHVPAFPTTTQLTEAEFRKAQSTARLRVHVERMIRRVKEHRLFSTVVPMSLTGCLNQLFAVACLLVNYQNGPIVKAGPENDV